ncbi:MAG: hypothetical protein OEW58_01895 [Gammaproteobacteria bacterium]|nr:hypothetical protein [Gammaproteobacteria bacterium]
MRVWMGLMVVVMLIGCSSNPLRTGGPETVGEVLIFLEQSSGQSQRYVRYLMSDNGIRIEVGGNNQKYWLFDAEQYQLFSVDMSSRTVEVFAKGMPDDQRIPLAWTHQEDDSFAMPRNVARTQSGVSARHHRLDLAGQPCLELVAVRSMLPASLQKLSDYRRYMARYAAAGWQDASSAARDCQRAMFIQQPELAFSQGFPLREWNVAGDQRFLQDARENVKMDAQLFEIPKNYSKVSGATPTF